MKKIFYLFLTIIGLLAIYYSSNKKINYVFLGDDINYNKYLNKKDFFSYNDFFQRKQIKELLNDVKTNRTIRINNKEYYLKKILRESDIVVISIGMHEIKRVFNKYDMKNNYFYFHTIYKDIKLLLNEIKKYAQEKIVFLGFYNPINYYDSAIDSFFYNVDDELYHIMKEYNAIYLPLYETKKENNNNFYKLVSSKIAYYLN